MGHTKGRRVREIDATDSPPEFELGTLWQLYSRGRRLGQEKGRKRHRNRVRRPGGRKLDTARGGSVRKVVQEQTKVTQKWIHALRAEERQVHLNRNPGTRRCM